MEQELRTRRLVIVDANDQERIVAEVRMGSAELRISLPNGASVLCHASEHKELGPGIGIQLWADGDTVAEIDAWPNERGVWRAHYYIKARRTMSSAEIDAY